MIVPAAFTSELAFAQSNDAQQQIALSQSAAIWGRKT
jgi:hypothetical protein